VIYYKISLLGAFHMYAVWILLHVLPYFGRRRTSRVQEIITTLSNVASSRRPDWLWDKTNPFAEEWTKVDHYLRACFNCTRCAGTKRERSGLRLTPM